MDVRGADGKVVWFEVGVSGRSARQGPRGAVGPEDGTQGPRPPAGAVSVHLLGAPVRLMATMQQDTETLLREWALVSVEAAEEWAPIALGVDFDELDHQLAAAMRAGEATTDLLLHVLPDSEPTVRKADDALRHGDRLASEGWLLCPPALPEVADCRRWFFEQLLGQLHGESAEPWRPRPHSSAEETPAVDHAAHIAGYTRYLLTGQPRLLNTPVRVPAASGNTAPETPSHSRRS